MNLQVATEYRLLATEERCTHIVSCDVHDKFGTVYLAETGDRYTVNVNGTVWRTWRKQQWPFTRRVKWFESDAVLVWITGEGAIVLSRDDTRTLQYGTPSNIFVSENYAYVTYGEDASSSFASSPEFSIISVYSKVNGRVLGLDEVIDNVPYSGTPNEVSQACTSEDVLIFLLDNTPHIWTLDAPSRGVSCIGSLGDLARTLAISVSGQMLFLLKSAANEQHYLEVCRLDPLNVTKLGVVEALEISTFNPDRIHGIPGGMFVLSKRSAVTLLKVALPK